MFQFIEEHAVRYRVKSLCRVLDVSRSGFYEWRRRSPSRCQQANEQLVAQISEIHQQSRQTYGSPRIWHALRHRGISCSRKRVVKFP
jgi:hypothetical protein